ncbi:carbohydrate-binding protein [Novosphingobium sp.]|uniref:carbohydrate-binding protein n=1 Tax=Novosphingobium sp. TaxID=1874826 RepID=UPI003D6D32FE
MKVILDGGEVIDLGVTEATPTIGIVDYSRRVTDDYGVTTVVERGFARRMSVRLVVPFDQTDALQRNLAAIRAKPARWVADDRFAWLDFRGFFKDFEIDLAVPPKSYCTLTVEALADTEAFADPGGDPAPGGAASTLQLLQPITIEGAALAASTVPENDYPEWSADTTYALGARVIKAATHRIYESGALGNKGNDPAGISGKWSDVGPTNRWAMFDQALGSTTAAAGAITVTLAAGTIDAVALLDVKGAAVRVQAAGYDRTAAPNASGTITFLDMPETAGQVIVTVTGAGTVEVGTLLVGQLVGLGSTTDSPKAGITDFSRKEADEFGDVQVVERAWAKRMTLQAKLRRDAIDLVAGRIAAVRAKPSLWIGKEGMETLTAYGFFKDFTIEVDATVCTLSLSIEGLSTAGKVEPLTASVAWPDITDPDGTKPDDNATRNVNRGDWAPGVAYNVGDFFQYGGSSYTVITAHVSAANLPPPNQYVSLLASVGAEGEKGDKGDTGAKGDAGSNGAAGEAAITPSLTTPAYQVWAYANGVVKSYDGATTTFVLKQGGADISASFNMVIAANPNGLQVTLSGRTATVVGATANAGQFGNTNVLGATLTLRAIGTGTYVGRNFDLNFTLGKLLGGYEIVTALPTANNFEGRIVYNNTDGKLYTYTNGAWKTGVDAADIAGEIVADQFAPTIEPVTLVTSVPTEKSTNVVFNTANGKTYRWNGQVYEATVEASDIAGGITASQFASGIEPITNVTSLPSTKLTTVVAYNGKLYRWNGSSYTASVATTDLSGSIVAAQFAAGIEPVTLVSGALPTTRITNVITYGGKLYRWNGAAYVSTTAAADITGTLTSDQIAGLDAAKLAGQIVGTQITDGAISTAKLAAGSVSAAKIAAGSITAEKMTLFDSTNMVNDSQFASTSTTAGAASWQLLGTAVVYTGGSNALLGVSQGVIHWGTGSAGQTGSSARTAPTGMIVEPGKPYRLYTVFRYNLGFTGSPRAVARWYKADGTAASTPFTSVTAAGTDFRTIAATGTANAVIDSVVTAPADAFYMQFDLFVDWSTTLTNPTSTYALFGNPRVMRAANAELIVDGAITAGKIAAKAITAAQIATDTITAAEIAAGAVSASEIAAGAVTASKLSIGEFSNLMLGGDLVAGTLDGWSRVNASTTGAAGSSVICDGPSNGWPTTYGINMYRAAGATGEISIVNGNIPFSDANYMNGGFDLAAGEQVYFECYTWSTNTTAGLLVEMLMRVPSNTTTYGSQPAVALSNCSGGYYLTAKPGQVMTKISGYFTNNTGVAGKAFIRLVHTGFSAVPAGAQNTNVYVWSAKATRRNAGKLIVDGSITANQIAGQTITAAQIAGQTITAAQIAGDTITAAQIAAGAVNASEIAAKAITVSKLAVVPESIIPDPYFADEAWWTGTRLDASGWYFDATAASQANYAAPKITALGPQANVRKHLWSATYPYSGAGQTVRLRAWGINGTNDVMYVTVRFVNSAGAGVGDLTVTFPAGVAGLSNRTNQLAVPGTAVGFQVIIFNEGNVAGNGFMLVSGIKMDVAASADLLVDGSITAGKIAADTITAGQIAAGAITASELASRSITATHLTMTDYENLMVDGDLASGTLSGWSRSYGGVSGMIIQAEDGGVGTTWPARFALHMLRNGNANSGEMSITNGTGTWDNNNKIYGIPVNPGDEFAFETTCWCSNGAGVSFDMIMLDTTGNLTWMVVEAVLNTGGTGSTILTAYPGEGFVILKGTFKNTSGRQGRANLRFNGPTNATPNAHCYFWNSKMRRRNAAELIVDGNITASKIAASAVTSDKISAGAVTAAKIAVTELSAITANIGLLRTATTGRRAEIDNNGLRSYDSNGTLRLRGGVWAV